MISIIIPVYNAAAFLPSTLDSILSQSYENFEIILVNDGSKDNSSEICHEYADRHRCIRVFDRENHGVAATRNFGLAKAEGDFVWFMDSDDLLAEGALADAVALQAAHDADVVIGGMNFCFLAENRTVLKAIEKEIVFHQSDFKEQYLDLFAKNYLSSLWNKLIRRSAILDCGLQLNENLSMYEDYAFCMDLILTCRTVVCTPRVYYNYLFRATQSLSHRYKTDIDQMLYILRDMIAGYKRAMAGVRAAEQSLDNLMIYLAYECVKNESRCKEAPLKKMRDMLRAEDFQNIMREFHSHGRRYQTVQWLMKHRMVLAIRLYLKATGKVGA